MGKPKKTAPTPAENGVLRNKSDAVKDLDEFFAIADFRRLSKITYDGLASIIGIFLIYTDKSLRISTGNVHTETSLSKCQISTLRKLSKQFGVQMTSPTFISQLAKCNIPITYEPARERLVMAKSLRAINENECTAGLVSENYPAVWESVQQILHPKQ